MSGFNFHHYVKDKDGNIEMDISRLTISFGTFSEI